MRGNGSVPSPWPLAAKNCCMAAADGRVQPSPWAQTSYGTGVPSVEGESARIARAIAWPEAARAAPGAESPGKSTSRFSCTKAYSLTAHPSRDRGVPSGAATDQSRRSSVGDGNTHSVNEGAAAVASRERYTSPRAWTLGQPTPLSSGA